MTVLRFSLKALMAVVALSAIALAFYPILFPERPEEFTSTYFTLDETKQNPPGSLCWYRDSIDRPVAGFVIIGKNHPHIWVSNQRGVIKVPSRDAPQITLPRDGFLYILTPSFTFQRTTVRIADVAEDWQAYDNWARPIAEQIKDNTWPQKATEPSVRWPEEEVATCEP